MNRLRLDVLVVLLLAAVSTVAADPPLPPGTILIYAGKTPPQGWLVCNGDQVDVQRYPALYAVIGTVYGGDGVNKFNLPDLRGRVPIGAGRGGANMSDRTLAQTGGEERVALKVSELPAHSHEQTTDDDKGAAGGNNQRDANGGNETAGVVSGRTRNTGDGQSHENMQPFIVLNFIIRAF